MRPEHHILATELKDMVRTSVRTVPDSSESVRRWIESGAKEKAHRFLAVNESAAVEVRAGVMRSAVVNEPSLVHLFWLLDLDDALIVRYIQLLRDSKIRHYLPIPKFWSNYVEAVGMFSGVPGISETKYEAKGYEKFWLPYLDFMAGRTSWIAFATEAQTSFVARNRQARSIDWIGWDGDGKEPARWDLRFESIKRKMPNHTAEPVSPSLAGSP